MLEITSYPKPWLLLQIAEVLALGYLVLLLAHRVRGWARGSRLNPLPPLVPGKIARIWFLEVFAQPQIKRLSRTRWAAHLCIFWGFLSLSALSLFLAGLRFVEARALGDGRAAWLLHGDGNLVVKIWGNGFGLVLLAGLLLALARRLRPLPTSTGDAKEADTPLLVFLLWLTLSGFLLEGLRIAAASPATPAAGALRPWLTALWTIHGFSGVALIVLLPHSKLMHGVLAPLVIALNACNEHARKDLSCPVPAPNEPTASPKA
ncbi:MAG: hypothetical protein ACYC9Y_05355 [Candidatus Methylomirabilia bacterium]